MLGICLVYSGDEKMEAHMHDTSLMVRSFPMPAQAVALLPGPWQNLGSTLLGWIQQRGQLPVIMEKLPRHSLVHFRTLRVTAAPQHTTTDQLDAMYQAWRNAQNMQTRRQALGNLTQAFMPLIRATIRHCQISQLADRADLEQEAFVGLHDALQSYDPRRSVTLAGFVRWRIVGAVLDARRKWARQSRHSPVGDLLDGGAANPALQMESVSHTPSVEFEDMFTVLTRGLSGREIFVLRRVILEDQTCRQIGQLMGLHHGRVGQIYRGAIAHLRDNPRARQLLAGGRDYRGQVTGDRAPRVVEHAEKVSGPFYWEGFGRSPL